MSPRIPTSDDSLAIKRRAAKILKVLKEAAKKTLNSGIYLSPDRKEFLNHILSKKTFSGDLSPWAGLLSKEVLQQLRKLALIEDTLVSKYDPKYYSATDIQRIFAQITKMEPHAERGLKILNAAKLGGNTPRPDIEKKHAEWQQIADEIWMRHPNKSKYDVAHLIKMKVKEGNPNTIRRVIKKRIM